MKKIKFLWIILTFIPIILLILGYIYPSSFFSNQESIRAFVSSWGVFAPLAFILLQIIQVVLTPISHYAVSIAGGFIFGTWKGFLYNWIGRIIGTLIAFYLGRLLGRKIIKRIVKPATIKKYDVLLEKGKLLMFLAYFLPLFPDDEISYLAGFSSLSARAFIPIMILGHISGSLSLAYLGSGVPSLRDPLFIFLTLVTLIGGVLFAVFYKKLNEKNKK